MAAFEEMGILPEIGKAVEEMEWSLPTDIQAEAIPLILGGGDVLMAAETGSGKTGAFCLPVLQIVWETLNDKNKARSSGQSMDKWLLAFKDRSENLVVSNDGLSCQSKDAKQWQGVRANRGIVRDPKVRTNKFYYEVYFKEAGLARVGWALSNGSLDLGTDKIGWGFGGTGKKSNSRNFENYGTTFGDRGDIIGNVLDLDSETISWTKNGEYLGEAFRIPKNFVNQAFYPCVCTKNAMVTVRFEKSTEGKSDAPPNFNWVSKASSSQYINNTNIGTSTDEKTKVIGPRAVIIEPSRELAEQTLKCLDSFKKYLPGDIRLLLIIGGGNAKEQMDQIRQGVDIVVATPGRLEDLVFNNALSLKQCRFFILDEVDGLLQQGHTDIINRLHAQIPRMFDDGRRLQMVVCSATLHNFDVKKLAERVMFFPAWVDLKGEDSVPETVHHVIFRIDPREDDLWKKLKKTIKTDGVHSKDRISPNQPNAETLSEAIKLLKGEYTVKAIDKLKVDQAIIFCRTKLDCDNLESYLNDIGGGQRQNLKYSCVCLHGDRRPQERKTNLEKFKAGEVKFLICTDVAARGIDIKGIPFVIQVTLPDEKANYVHRIGRVGRAERMGLAISLVACVPEKVWFHSNCANRGKNCFNTNLTQDGGCCIWYDELQLLADIEEHLGCTISTIGSDFKLEVNEFDGKVVYGEKRSGGSGINYKTHVDQLASVVKELSNLEGLAQMSSATGKENSKRGGKKKNFTPLLDFDNNVLLPGRHPCDCEASAHKLVNNCLSCGRIVCEQERVGECFTCGAYVNDKEIERQNQLAAAALADSFVNSHSSQGKENEKKKKNDKNKREGIRNIAASLEKAVQHKNKLLEFDSNCSQRTKVIDDETDYFKLTSQHWLSQDKRDKIGAKIDYLQDKKFSKERTLTLDIVNRRFEENVTPVISDVGKVVQELEEDAAFKSDYQIVDSKHLNCNEKLPRVNYCQQEQKANANKKGKQTKREKASDTPTSSSVRVSLFNRTSLKIQDPELMEMSDSGVCLTVQQPWASFIMAGIKLHEGRSWYTHYRGRIWIHASGKAVTQEEITTAKKTFALMSDKRFPIDYPRSLLLGCITLKDCLPQEDYKQSVANPYMESTYVWILEDPVPLKVKIPMNSKSNRLFNLDEHILKAAFKQLDFS